MKRQEVEKLSVVNRNEFELRGNHTYKRKLNPSYSQTTFNVKNNVYGVTKINPSDL